LLEVCCKEANIRGLAMLTAVQTHIQPGKYKAHTTTQHTHVDTQAHTSTHHARAHTQVVYSEPMAALRVRTLLVVNRPQDALSAMEVHYEAPPCVRGAPWRSWLALQARYHLGDLAVRAPVPRQPACQNLA